ncbi:MAG TPA: fumarate reductase subunit C [Burkholderiales bacterium]|nr:fumarate reductase subunit C [Burkholderiales bacterium]
MKTYQRPVTAWWWRRNPYYVWYMVREASCVVVTIYALILLVGLARLRQGEVAYEDWLERLSRPWAIGYHALAFVLVSYHAWTWFKIMPKTLPRVPVPDRAIVAAGVAAIGACSALLWWAAHV